jgi:hypothetical protein
MKLMLGMLGGVLVACGTSAANDPQQREPAGRSQEAIATSCITETQTYYSVTHGTQAKMKPLSTHFCWLTMANGDFNGEQPDDWYDTGQGVEVQSDGYWYVVNRDYNGNGTTQARCVALSCFTGDGQDDVVWVSTSNMSSIATANGSCDSHTNYTAWWGDAATVLRFWPGPGNTNGSGENVQVVQSSNASTASGIHAADCYSDGIGRFISGRAVSLFVGTPSSGQLAQFTGSDFVVSGDYTLNLGVHTDEAICFFTRIFGKFRGAGESVRVYQVADGSRYLWYAKSQQGGSGSGVKGQGKCFWFNQWDK